MSVPDPSLVTPAPPREAQQELDLEVFKALAADCHRIGTSRDGVPWSKVGDDVQTLIAEIERLRVEHTRAILHYTVKGYTAGKNTDAKHWRERAEKAEAALHASEAQSTHITWNRHGRWLFNGRLAPEHASEAGPQATREEKPK